MYMFLNIYVLGGILHLACEELIYTVTTLPSFPRRYTFGERVNGTVKINATLEASRRRASFLFYERTARLVQKTMHSADSFVALSIGHFQYSSHWWIWFQVATSTFANFIVTTG